MKKGKPSVVVIIILFLFGSSLANILFRNNIADLDIVQLLLGVGGVGAVIVAINEVVRYVKYKPEGDKEQGN
jgi:hypothetical protein